MVNTWDLADNWELAKYRNKWAVYNRTSRTFSYIGEGKRFCQNKAKELNEYDRIKTDEERKLTNYSNQ